MNALDTWISNSNIPLILKATDLDLLDEFRRSTKIQIDEDGDGTGALDDEFLYDFKPFPPKYESIRRLILGLYSIHQYWDNCVDSRLIDIRVGDDSKLFSEDLVELILDVLEDRPDVGVEKYGGIIEVTNSSRVENWLIPPKG